MRGWRRFLPPVSFWAKLGIVFDFLTQYGWMLLMLVLYSGDPKAPRYEKIDPKTAIILNMARTKP